MKNLNTTLKLNKEDVKQEDVDIKIENPNLVKIEENYTTSPDGKYKIPISEYNSDRLEENKTNIPQLKLAGYEIAWPHNVKPNSIDDMVAKGWQFVSHTDAGCEVVKGTFPAGLNSVGQMCFHYAMKMPTSKHKEMMVREEKARTALESGIQQAPSEESSAIYGTDDMEFKNNQVVSAKMS